MKKLTPLEKAVEATKKSGGFYSKYVPKYPRRAGFISKGLKKRSAGQNVKRLIIV